MKSANNLELLENVEFSTLNCKVLKFGSGLASVSEIALISIGCNDSLFKRRKNSVP